MTNRVPIGEMRPNQFIEGIYIVQNCQLGRTRSGKSYLRCILSDRTGRTPARMWNVSDDLYDRVPHQGFVWLEGQTQPYQGEMQVIIQNIAEADPSIVNLHELLQQSKHDPDVMFEELTAIMSSLSFAPLQALANAYLDDVELMAKFRLAPAAASLHHAYLSGLLEHTLSLLRLAEATLPLYPQLNRDIVLMGLFLHDLGKCVELTWETGFDYSEEGQLVGHIARGVVWLEQKADACDAAGVRIPGPVRRVLQHIILSHHGRPEFGALKAPATPEAIFISGLDNLDAKANMSLAATRERTQNDADDTDLGGNFTEKIWALETRLYKPDPTTAADDA